VLTHEELVNMNKDLLTTAAQAREYLEKEGYVLPDAWGGRAKLSYMLLLLLHAVPPSILPKGIRAVTTLLECEAACTADIIAAAILCKIDLVLNLMGKVANQAQGTDSDTSTAVYWLYRTGEEMRDELKKGMDMAKEDIQRAMECFNDKVSKLNQATASATNGMGDMGGCQNKGGAGACHLCRCAEQVAASGSPQHTCKALGEREASAHRQGPGG